MAGYAEDWKEYKRLRNQWILVFLGYVRVVGTFGYLSIKLLHSTTPTFAFASFWGGFIPCHWLAGPTMEMPSMWKLVFGKVVVQQRLPG